MDEIKPEEKKEDKHWQFKPGVSGNPSGRPKGNISVIRLLQKKLKEIEPKHQKSYADLVITRWLLNAIDQGNQKAIKDIVNYIDGMPKQSIDLSHTIPQNLIDLIKHGSTEQTDGEELSDEDSE